MQNKAFRLINFQPSNTKTGPLNHANKIWKIGYFIHNKNALFVRNTLRRENPPQFIKMLNMLNQNHTYNTRAATCNLIDITQVPISHFGESSIRLKTSQTWNELQRSLNMVFLNYGASGFKKSIFQTYFSNYNNV